MRRLFLAALLSCTALSAWAQGHYPSPDVQNHTVHGNQTVTGTSVLNGGGTLAGTWAGNPTFSGNLTHQGTSTFQGAATFGTNTAIGSELINGPNNGTRIGPGISTAGSRRWQWQTNGNETGVSNAGTDWRLMSYSDANASIGEVMRFVRQTGAVSFNASHNFDDPIYSMDGTLKVVTRWNNAINLMTSGTLTIPASPRPQLGQYPFLFGAGLTSGGVLVAPIQGVCILCINIPTDDVAFDPANQANQTQDISVSHTWGGAAARGSRTAMTLQLVQGSQTDPTDGIGDSSVGLGVTASADAIMGNTAHAGGVTGIDVVAMSTDNTLGGGAFGGYGVTGIEVDIQARGDQPIGKNGIIVNSNANDLLDAKQISIGMGVASGGVVPGHGFGIVFGIGRPGAQFPVLPTTTIFGMANWDGADNYAGFASLPGRQLNQPQANNGIELSRMIFNGGGDGTGRAIAVPGFSVDDQALVNFYSGAIQGVAAGLTIDTTLYRQATISSVGASTHAVYANDIIWEETCKVRGVAKVTAVAAGAATAVTMLRPSACATNPGSLTFKTSEGATVVLNVTWTAPAAQTVTVGATGSTSLASVSVLAPNLPTSAPGTNCALWVNAGVVTRTTCP